MRGRPHFLDVYKRQDYYRNLPSYQIWDYQNEASTMAAARIADEWIRNVNNIRYFDWDGMYQSNYDNRADDQEIYGTGRLSNYMIEERHTDQLDWNLMGQFSHLFKDNSRIVGGADLRVNKTHYYDQVKDLLGGDFWICLLYTSRCV